MNLIEQAEQYFCSLGVPESVYNMLLGYKSSAFRRSRVSQKIYLHQWARLHALTQMAEFAPKEDEQEAYTMALVHYNPISEEFLEILTSDFNESDRLQLLTILGEKALTECPVPSGKKGKIHGKSILKDGINVLTPLSESRQDTPVQTPKLPPPQEKKELGNDMDTSKSKVHAFTQKRTAPLHAAPTKDHLPVPENAESKLDTILQKLEELASQPGIMFPWGYEPAGMQILADAKAWGFKHSLPVSKQDIQNINLLLQEVARVLHFIASMENDLECHNVVKQIERNLTIVLNASEAVHKKEPLAFMEDRLDRMKAQAKLKKGLGIG